MATVKRWTVDVRIDERGGRTHAEARLHSGETARLTGVGDARLNPADTDVPAIGDELAAARALSDLGHQLLVTTAADLRAVVGHPVRLGT
ncbi:DUF1876 domain-containing protein [Dactylosporangium sp. NPDC051484]|uniref:DUF1876 domain-containing protein n=1 Tax=Dactylosporangium sp. NPDC051484 TaxID=3154942 RepID=UPI00344EF558